MLWASLLLAWHAPAANGGSLPASYTPEFDVLAPFSNQADLTSLWAYSMVQKPYDFDEYPHVKADFGEIINRALIEKNQTTEAAAFYNAWTAGLVGLRTTLSNINVYTEDHFNYKIRIYHDRLPVYWRGVRVKTIFNENFTQHLVQDDITRTPYKNYWALEYTPRRQTVEFGYISNTPNSDGSINFEYLHPVLADDYVFTQDSKNVTSNVSKTPKGTVLHYNVRSSTQAYGKEFGNTAWNEFVCGDTNINACTHMNKYEQVVYEHVNPIQRKLNLTSGSLLGDGYDVLNQGYSPVALNNNPDCAVTNIESLIVMGSSCFTQSQNPWDPSDLIKRFNASLNTPCATEQLFMVDGYLWVNVTGCCPDCAIPSFAPDRDVNMELEAYRTLHEPQYGCKESAVGPRKSVDLKYCSAEYASMLEDLVDSDFENASTLCMFSEQNAPYGQCSSANFSASEQMRNNVMDQITDINDLRKVLRYGAHLGADLVKKIGYTAYDFTQEMSKKRFEDSVYFAGINGTETTGFDKPLMGKMFKKQSAVPVDMNGTNTTAETTVIDILPTDFTVPPPRVGPNLGSQGYRLWLHSLGFVLHKDPTLVPRLIYGVLCKNDMEPIYNNKVAWARGSDKLGDACEANANLTMRSLLQTMDSDYDYKKKISFEELDEGAQNVFIQKYNDIRDSCTQSRAIGDFFFNNAVLDALPVLDDFYAESKTGQIFSRVEGGEAQVLTVGMAMMGEALSFPDEISALLLMTKLVLEDQVILFDESSLSSQLYRTLMYLGGAANILDTLVKLKESNSFGDNNPNFNLDAKYIDGEGTDPERTKELKTAGTLARFVYVYYKTVKEPAGATQMLGNLNYMAEAYMYMVDNYKPLVVNNNCNENEFSLTFTCESLHVLFGDYTYFRSADTEYLTHYQVMANRAKYPKAHFLIGPNNIRTINISDPGSDELPGCASVFNEDTAIAWTSLANYIPGFVPYLRNEGFAYMIKSHGKKIAGGHLTALGDEYYNYTKRETRVQDVWHGPGGWSAVSTGGSWASLEGKPYSAWRHLIAGSHNADYARTKKMAADYDLTKTGVKKDWKDTQMVFMPRQFTSASYEVISVFDIEAAYNTVYNQMLFGRAEWDLKRRPYDVDLLPWTIDRRTQSIYYGDNFKENRYGVGVSFGVDKRGSGEMHPKQDSCTAVFFEAFNINDESYLFFDEEKMWSGNWFGGLNIETRRFVDIGLTGVQNQYIDTFVSGYPSFVSDGGMAGTLALVLQVLFNTAFVPATESITVTAELINSNGEDLDVSYMMKYGAVMKDLMAPDETKNPYGVPYYTATKELFDEIAESKPGSRYGRYWTAEDVVVKTYYLPTELGGTGGTNPGGTITASLTSDNRLNTFGYAGIFLGIHAFFALLFAILESSTSN